MTDRSQVIKEVKRMAHQMRHLLAFAETLEDVDQLDQQELATRNRLDALRADERALTEHIAKLEIDGQARHDAAIHQAELIIAGAEKIRAEAAKAVITVKQEATREIAAAREAAQAEIAPIEDEIAAKTADLQALTEQISAQQAMLAAINAQLADMRSRLGG